VLVVYDCLQNPTKSKMAGTSHRPRGFLWISLVHSKLTCHEVHNSFGSDKMHTIWKCLTCVIFVASAFGQSPEGRAGDEIAIREVVQKYMDARENKDSCALEALFTIDADQLVSTGEWRKGRGEIVQGTQASSQKTGGKRTIDVVSVRFVTSGMALVDGRYELTGLAGGGARKMWTTLILIRSIDRWRIAAIRNMLPAAPAPSK
jgi:uncharacterized protein (TIGR02246 family)